MERFNRAPRNPRQGFYRLEDDEVDKKRFDDIDEFFNIPKSPMAILHEDVNKQKTLAYRDGTRNADGSLPRAKVIYRTGYA